MNPPIASLPFVPEQASTVAPQVDAIYWGLVAISAVITLGLFAVITCFLIRYRSTSKADRTMERLNPTYLEVTWTVIPMIIFIGLFVWGAIVFAEASKPPPGALPIYIVGVQWYWDVRHENGRREIGDLHVPVGRPVQLILTSADVIHDYFIPAFRTKRDVVPGRYTTVWFTATKPGKYRLFCNQYCGTKHSQMDGYVYAMRPEAYQAWLDAPNGTGQATLAQTGERLFRQYSCSGCHGANSGVHAPSLDGLYGHDVPLQGGGFVNADEQYLRDSILRPGTQIVAGYKPIMPNFQGQISEQNVIALIAYIKSLSSTPNSVAAQPPDQAMPPSP
ncbi:MAG TPA: cytochrome c oxidase subunit II [Chthoniobacteraceae bacterium]|nr:cytochrome c oxidase subunit II [Chthoniobacteraceae bacterium]